MVYFLIMRRLLVNHLGLNFLEFVLNVSLLTKDCFLILLNLCDMLLDLSLLEFFLLNLGAKDSNFILRLLEELILVSFLFLKLLFKATHQSIHHDISVGFHLQCALQLFVFLALLLYFLFLSSEAALKLIHLLSLCANDFLSLDLLEFLLLDLGFECFKTRVLLNNLLLKLRFSFSLRMF